MARYAYVRVSSKEQKIDRQIIALKPYNIKEQNIFCDYQSGKDFNRPAYLRLLKKLKSGDELYVKSIDRLGRNYNEILIQWQLITKEKKADIIVLDMDLLDTRKKEGNLTGTLIADIVLQLLAYVSEKERESIRIRQAEGIAVAKKKGIKFGCPKKPLPRDFEKYYNAWMLGEITLKEGAENLEMSISTFFRRCKEMKNNQKM